MPELDVDLRNQLEKRVVEARDISEAAAAAALKHLGVAQKDAPAYLSEPQRHLRRALRAKARQLGDPLEREPANPTPALERELAYERWHQMLFAAFLAHNDLLIHPTEKVPVTLQDCQELAPDEGDPDGWHTAARYASHMLPGIFKPTDPLLQVGYAPEDHQALERVLDDIPPPTYTSDDGLGWVYQFWQTKRKKQVNESGVKIGGADISPVTQLFTEHYMVQFLLHNTLGAWWTARHPDIPLPTHKSYLRTLDDGTPAAGTFDGWPTTAKDITVMDPCCGSGHFLIAAFTLLQRFRMIEEGLTEAEAGDAVLRDNLHGLELDPRCTQLAAFNVALHAWKHGGYRPLPSMNIACSGISAGGSEADWTNLTDDPRAKNALKRLHHLFRNAPDLGSLIDPSRLAEEDPLYTASFKEANVLLGEAISRAGRSNPSTSIFGDAALGISHAAQLLTRQYWLVPTNVPFLARGKMGDDLLDFVFAWHRNAMHDLATVFIERIVALCRSRGAYAIVSPQAWYFLPRFATFRRDRLVRESFHLAAQLGEGAFSSGQAAGAFVALTIASKSPPSRDVGFSALDVTADRTLNLKVHGLLRNAILRTQPQNVLSRGKAHIRLDGQRPSTTMGAVARSWQGLVTGDDNRYLCSFWELGHTGDGTWAKIQRPPQTTEYFTGRSQYVRWEGGKGSLHTASGAHNFPPREALGRLGVAVQRMRGLSATIFDGLPFNDAVAPIVPFDSTNVAALWCYASSPEFKAAVRRINQKVNVTPGTFHDIDYEVGHWSQVAAKRYPQGLPRPFSNDPTQWLFHGHPAPATEPLQVAVARLLGYRWPAETDTDMELSDEARAWIARSAELNDLADSDGIVCLPPVAGEKPAAERLRVLLATAYGEQWSPTTEAALLATVDYDGKTLHDWLSGDFFKQHCKTFNNRPFIWHVSDGTKDGFSALVNYHKLDRALLERLIYTYLGSYIRQQQDAAKANTRGADLKLAKAEELKAKLELILEGEAPYDIFVRWKPLHEQPIGWEPDLNDGVRLNIRPFVTAGVLRSKFTINWNKDRGNDPSPNATGTTERHNDRHLTLAEKRAARAAKAT